MRCNIDGKGKLVRLIYGCILVVTGIALTVFWAVPSQTVLAWALSLGLIIGGAFAVFEAGTGWCVIRAMGFKTSI
jgi:hypothetical protein